MTITRREFAGTLAMAAAASYDAALVRRHDEATERILKQQVIDPAHPGCGGYADDYGLFNPGTAAGILETMMAAHACPQSRFYGSAMLVERMKLAAGYLKKRQHSDGTMDLLITNFHSTPDVGFIVHGVAAAAWLARETRLAVVTAELEPFLKGAGEALARGGVHTPNHRWVVCEALAQVNELYPDARYVKRIDQWLAEGIDIDEDGQYNERSTTVYNPVTDKALLVVALKLKRPELLEPVRKNLASMLYLMHPGGEVVTEISTRQDQYDRAGMERYWFPLRYMALLDGNGQLAEVVRRVEDRAASLSAYLRYPELSRALPASQPLPENFSKLMPALQIARVRRGPMSASILMNGNSRFFAMRNGACVVEAVRFASAFFGKGQFKALKWEQVQGGYRMTQSMEGPYYQPLDPPRRVATSEYGESRALRKQSEVQRMEYAVTVRENRKGFRIEIEAHGTDGVPVAIEVALRDNAVLEGVTPAPRAEHAYLLKEGYATARMGKEVIRFGPGFGDHAYTQLRGADPKVSGNSVYLCGFTPLKRVIEFEAAI